MSLEEIVSAKALLVDMDVARFEVKGFTEHILTCYINPVLVKDIFPVIEHNFVSDTNTKF